MNRDTNNLHHDADFETEVYPRIFWTLANILAMSRYSSDDMKMIVKLSPSEKQSVT